MCYSFNPGYFSWDKCWAWLNIKSGFYLFLALHDDDIDDDRNDNKNNLITIYKRPKLKILKT